MSLNKFMHSRNIYRNRPDYLKMAKEYRQFGQFVKCDLSGRPNINYNDPNALRELTKTLLKKDFGLEVDIPDNRLIPTVPQRLNYILWIEDLVTKLQKETDLVCDNKVIGIDIGTGASCIFPLLGCVKNKNWNFIANDIDKLNVEFALKNVEANNLKHRISVIESTEDSLFKEVTENVQQQIHFLMCNPPFFDDHHDNSNDSIDSMEETEEESGKKNFPKKKMPSNTSDCIESVCQGGESEFVKKIIQESLELGNKITIYTTMTGRKKSFQELKSIIKSHIENGHITSYTTTEFCQGKTKRWGIAWTTLKEFNLKDAPTIKCAKTKPPLEYVIPPKLKDLQYNLKSVSDRIKSLLKDELQMDYLEVIRESKHSVEIWVKTNRNTWTGQRRKRRQAKFEQSKSDQPMTDTNQPEINKDDNLDDKTNSKRKLNDSFNECKEEKQKRLKDDKNLDVSKEAYLLNCSVIIKRINYTLFLKVQSKEPSISKETSFQLFQYLKNKLI